MPAAAHTSWQTSAISRLCAAAPLTGFFLRCGLRPSSCHRSSMQADATQRLESLLVALQQAVSQQGTRLGVMEERLNALNNTIVASITGDSNTNSSSTVRQAVRAEDCGCHAAKRPRARDVTELPLFERDDLLLRVMIHVGTTEWLYMASISRRWRGLYLCLCVKHRKILSGGEQHVMLTSWAAATSTAERLQLAFVAGLDVEKINGNLFSFAETVGDYSLDPIGVTTLARVRGVNWHEVLCTSAAYEGDWAFLKWLRAAGCPWRLHEVYFNAMSRSTKSDIMSALTWVKEQHADTPLEADELQALMFDVGAYRSAKFVVWLQQELQAPWPEAFAGLCSIDGERTCWSASKVRYALEQGSGWGVWLCQDLEPSAFETADQKRTANHLFKWAHTNAVRSKYNLPCTCDTEATDTD